MRHTETNSTDYYQHRAEIDRIQREVEHHARLNARASRAPSKQLDAYDMEQDRLKQASNGAHE